jgi:ABC-2 type transport system ATP-binding protein
MRELLKELRRMGKTIVISSHFLHELAELCNVVGIVERGKLVYSGSVADVMRRTSAGMVIQVMVDERAEEASELLAKVKGVTRVEMVDADGGVRIDVSVDPESGFRISEIPARLVANGFRLASMQREQVNLETAFMRLTKGLVQ